MTLFKAWAIDGHVIVHHIWIGLAGGALAFAHCLGMCGGFALYLAGSGSRAALIKRQLLWHSGRVFTYVFLGALAGFAGQALTASTAVPHVQKALAYGAGGIMLLMGLILLGVLPTLGRSLAGVADLLAPLLRNAGQPPSLAGAFALGIGTGFLPCPVVFAFLALVVQTGTIAAGVVTMAALGAGTAWSLLLVGLCGHVFSAWLRRWASVTAGVVLVLLGAATALRGTEVFHCWLGCPPAASPGGKAAEAPCCSRPAAAQSDLRGSGHGERPSSPRSDRHGAEH